MITRTAFCPSCYYWGYPRTGVLFVVYGSTRQSLIVRSALRYGKRGFTPHIFHYQGIFNGFVRVEKYCCIHNCDVSIRKDKKQGYLIRVLSSEVLLMSLKDWNALQFLKGDPQFAI